MPTPIAKNEVRIFCQRRDLDEPRLTLERVGDAYRAVLSLTVGEHLVESGPHVAPSPHEAEQSAFAGLLGKLASDDPTPGDWVGPVREAELQRQNPKTRLLSSLILRNLPPPVFETVPILAARENAYEGTAVLELADGTDVCSPICRSRSKTAVEQASAHALLAHEAVREMLGRVPDVIALNYARPLLIELQQAGHVKDFAVSVVRLATPQHPLFQMQGWWVGSDGARRFIDPVEAPSKKAAEALAARAILDAVRATPR